jgi:hypothetical protein
MTFESNNFDMGSVLNRLRTIAEQGPAALNELDSEGGPDKEIDTGSFTRTMSRLAAIKDAVGDDNYGALKAGVRALYMNRRPNLQQMTALMDLLETVLAYVSEDNALFQRLKSDLNKDAKDAELSQTDEPAAGPEVGAPATVEPVQQQEPLRGLK